MSEKLEIAGREFDVTDRIRDYVTKKVAKLDRYLSSVDETHVELVHLKSARSAADRYVAQITVRGRGFILRAEERADDIRTALDAAIDKMQRRMVRYKDKHYRGRRDARSTADVTPEADILEDIAREEPPIIVRRKRFELIPMDELEAVEQMKLLGHDNFFIFFDIKSGVINVLYRRRDGTYGLIEPLVR
jgi:putative sigma-54 modulation protein